MLTPRSPILPALLLIALCAAPARADGQQPRLITVSGDADIRVPPDEVLITLGVETANKDISTAASQNAAQVKRVVALAREARIDTKDIGTDQITLQKRVEYVGGRNEFRDYVARRTVSVKLKELGRFEDLLVSLLKGGVTSIDGVQFCTAQLRKYRDQARAQALKAASEKARDMAAALGQRVGRPHTIQETQDGWSAWGGATRAAAYGNVQNTVQVADSGGDGGSSAVGMVTVNAKVTVSFELQ